MKTPSCQASIDTIKGRWFYSDGLDSRSAAINGFNTLLLTLFLFCLWPIAVIADTPSTTNPPSPTFQLIRMTPQGLDVPPGRQIVFEFDRDVIPIGQMPRTSKEVPIRFEPTLNCQWRWLNRRALACQLDESNALQPATLYRVTITSGLTTEQGLPLALPSQEAGEPRIEKHLVTERPKAHYLSFANWLAPDHPVIRIVFNQPVSRSSIAMSIRFGELATEVEPDPSDQELPLILPLPGEPLALIPHRPTAPEPGVSSDDRPTKIAGEEARRVWLLSPAAPLGEDRRIELTISPGLVSALGMESGIEGRVLKQFDTFPAFRYLGVGCLDSQSQRWIRIAVDTPPDKKPKCDPLRSIALEFSSPVIHEEVKKHLRLTPDLAAGRTDYDPWANYYSYSSLRRPHRRGQSYQVHLPEVLKAASPYQIQFAAEAIKDEFGRILNTAVDHQIQTDHRKPNLSMAYRQGVLEQGIDSEVPLVVTNIEQIDLRYRKLDNRGQEARLSKQITVPPVQDIAFAVPMGARELLDGRSGALYGSVHTVPPTDHRPPTFFAQVTPWQVHVKLGHFNSQVWVTDLASGKPVPDAQVQIYRESLQTLSATPKTLDSATTDGSGLANLAGSETLDPNLKLANAWHDETERLFVRVERGQEMALLPLDPHFSIRAYRVSDYQVYEKRRRLHHHLRAWGTTAQGVYRAGDRMQYKLYVRGQDSRRFIPPPEGEYRLEIVDPQGKTVETVEKIQLSRFGAIAGEYLIPRNAAVGWYRFKLSASFTDLKLWPMRVLVSDFTPSPFRVSSELNGDRFEPGDEVVTATQARLHAGGPYVEAQTRVTTTLRPAPLQVQAKQSKGFYFELLRERQRDVLTLHQQQQMLDDQGNLETRFLLADTPILFGRLTVESAVRDDRGKYVAHAASASYAGRDRFVGLKSRKWLFQEDQPAQIEYLVVDDQGKLVSKVAVEISIERRETTAARVKGAGNAYLTQYQHRWVPTSSCSGQSAPEPQLCEFVPEDPGTYRAVARINDSQGRPHQTTLQAWVAGKGQVLWKQPKNNSLPIIPESDSYRVGDTARFLVKNPFPGAKALINVERYGVLHSRVVTLEGNTPVIELPIEADYLPGVYLSVLVVSPRVESPPKQDSPEQGILDLGKPSFRMAYLKIPVKDPAKELQVLASTDRQQYKPRDTARLSLEVKSSRENHHEPVELVVAVLDESVFDLIRGGAGNFDPYQGFYHLDPLDVQNFSLITRLLGRQKFEKKGANSGGDGGASLDMRTLFKYVSYWNPSLEVDAEGRANLEFQVPDNLTGWRVLVLAATPSDQMGLGMTRFQVNKPTEIRPVMPNQLMEGDRFTAGFTVMNRTDKTRQVQLRIAAEGALEQPQTRELTLSLPPFKRQPVWLPLITEGPGEVRFQVSAGDELDRDSMTHSVVVNKRRSLVTAANYGSTVDESVVESIAIPESIFPDVGALSLELSPTAIANVEGAFDYIRRYRYLGWEQRLSKGVMASHYLGLKAYTSENFQWSEAAELPQQTLEMAQNYQAPSGGMVYWVPEDARVSPYLSAYTALAFNWLRDASYQVPEQVEQRLHNYLLQLLRRDLLPSFYSQGMASSVRAVALAALARHGKVTVQDLQRYSSHVEQMDLFGKAHFLLAAQLLRKKSPSMEPSYTESERLIQELTKKILAHASQSGGKFQFLEPWDDGYRYLLATPLRANCAILSAVSQVTQGAATSNTPDSAADPLAAQLADIPAKLVRTLTQSRGNRDHWENTQENLFCMNALRDYAKAFETQPPAMQVRAQLDQELLGETRFTGVREPSVTLSHPLNKDDPGHRVNLHIDKQGEGRLYYSTRLQYAPIAKAAERINAGIDIRREYSVERNGHWQLLSAAENKNEKTSESMKIRRGELVRIDLYISLPAARHFVVVDDPVPGGLEPVNRDLATASEVNTDKGAFQAAGGSWWFRYSDWRYYGTTFWNFYHKELRHDSARFYADYLPAGNYHLSYVGQAIATGEFAVLPLHSEEMYDPDIFAKGLPAMLRVSDEEDLP